ncbi:lytic transglycosylase domain-containing protein [Candidatus Riflebacteria bacterium]
MGLERIGFIRARMRAIRERFGRKPGAAASDAKQNIVETKKVSLPFSPKIQVPALPPLLPSFSNAELKISREKKDFSSVLDRAIEESTKNTKSPARFKENNFQDKIIKAARKYGLDNDLLHSIIKVESDYNPLAISPKGAMGLMQLMPETAKSLGVRDPFNPLENLEGGSKLLAKLFKKYDNNLDLVLSAYNAGEANVDKYRGVPPFRETREYVKKIRERMK